MSPQTLQNRLGTPFAVSSGVEFGVCGCCIFIDASEGDELVALRFGLNGISSDTSLFILCSSSFD